MNIFIDTRWVRTDYHDGISRYTAGIIQGLKDNNIPITLLIYDKKQLDLLPTNTPHIIVNHPINIRELFIAHKLNRLGADVVFSPMQIMGSIGRKYKLILTLHDVIYYRQPKPPTNLPASARLVWRLFHMVKWPQRFLLNGADHVVTVSQTSKKFIHEMRLTDREISVVYNASSLNLSNTPTDAVRTKDIIYMGSFMPYKNVETLISGMAYLPENYNLHLLSKISKTRQDELTQLVKPKVNVVFHNGVSDQEYIDLLKRALCLATGSTEEGFGLPIIEAQTLGTPVVCSNMEIFHEVAGDGALFFEANSPQKFAQQVLTLNDPSTLTNLIKKGHKQAENFTWDKSAKALYEICDKLYSMK